MLFTPWETLPDLVGLADRPGLANGAGLWYPESVESSSGPVWLAGAPPAAASALPSDKLVLPASPAVDTLGLTRIVATSSEARSVLGNQTTVFDVAGSHGGGPQVSVSCRSCCTRCCRSCCCCSSSAPSLGSSLSSTGFSFALAAPPSTLLRGAANSAPRPRGVERNETTRPTGMLDCQGAAAARCPHGRGRSDLACAGIPSEREAFEDKGLLFADKDLVPGRSHEASQGVIALLLLLPNRVARTGEAARTGDRVPSPKELSVGVADMVCPAWVAAATAWLAAIAAAPCAATAAAAATAASAGLRTAVMQDGWTSWAGTITGETT